ncbi:MAG: PilN domain-containing protein [Pseudomonadota bacterium]|nr:PilN domain-containing protein [Pseudomonadota bacterium]
MLPHLAPADLAHAVQLEVQSSSPFPPGDTVHGFTAMPAGDTLRVELAITSRAQCQAALARAGAGAGDDAEIWLQPPPAQAQGAYRPLVLRGWGEAARERRVQRGQLRQLGWVGLVLALLLALALTPTAFKRQQAIEAQRALDAVQRQAAPQIAQRDALMQRTQSLEAIAALADQQLALAPVIDMLTRAVPDGAWLTSIRVEGDRVVLNGQADDAAALVQRLATQPGVTGARLSSPATRGAGDKKERFVIELHASAQRYGPIRAASAAGEGAS